MLRSIQGFHSAAKMAPGNILLINAELLIEDRRFITTSPNDLISVYYWQWERVGLSESDVKLDIKITMENFAKWRGRIYVLRENHDTLFALSECSPLFLIANSNADLQSVAWCDVFNLLCVQVIMAGPNLTPILIKASMWVITWRKASWVCGLDSVLCGYAIVLY
jgi:hypothetical protein